MTSGITRGAVRRLRTQGDRNAREEEARSAMISSRTTRTATTTTARGSRLPYGEPISAVARHAETDIDVDAVVGASPAQT